jgi:putative phage-type endonuclease
MESISQRIDFTSQEEWLNFKDGRIGGSSIATLLGLNMKYETPYSLWEKMTGKVPKFEGNAATTRGTLLEPAIVAWVELELGWTANKDTIEDYVYQHIEHPFIIGSPDREAWVTGLVNDKRIIEAKSTRMPITPDSVSDSWVVQVNHYMGLSGIHKGVIAWINGNLEFQHLMVEFNQELFDLGIDAAIDFMMNYVYPNIPPDILNSEDAARRYPVQAIGKSFEASESVVELITDVARLKKETKAHEEILKEKEGELKMLIGDSESISYLGERLVTFKYTKGRVGFDGKTFKEDYPEMYQQYMKEGTGYRTLRIYNQ